MDLGIQGLRVAISGAASGIGLGMTRRFLEEGARVCICDSSEAAIEKMDVRNPNLFATVCDVSDRSSVERWVREIANKLGGLDCLVNNAGIAGPTGLVQEIAPEDWDRTFSINITGQFNVTRLALALFESSTNASILNMSSSAGRLGFAQRSPYAASKWAVIGFTKSLAKELGPKGIRVNAMLPGLVDGERIFRVFADKAAARGISPEEQRDAALSHVSMRKLVPIDELADMAVYLASPRAGSVSGQAISVCGDLEALV